MSNKLQKLLDEKPVLLLDGATGTNLFAMGLQSGDSPEFWNVDHPDRIAKHYRSFIDQDRVHELNSAAARILCEEVAKSNREIVVAGSMGPTGEILEPAGSVTIEQAQAAYEEQALALKEGGVDVLWIETISSIEESHAAIRGASIAGLPIVLTLSIDTNGRTMMGVTAADLVNLQNELEVPLIGYGTNCGVGASEVVAAIMNMDKTAKENGVQPVLIAKGNVASMRAAIDEHNKGDTPDIDEVIAVLGSVTAGAQAQLKGDQSVEGGAVSKGRRGGRSRRR